MKANELRIGNWVYSTIIEDNMQVGALQEGIPIACKPIPLTEEWLLKFGFKEGIKDYLGFYRFKKDKFVVIREQNVFGYPYEDYEGNEFDLELEHVHQLQNLYFALTNKELTI